MFSDNRKISERQIFRLLTYDLLGLGTLLLPTALAKMAGRDGIFGILLGVGAGFLYLGLIKKVLGNMKGSYTDYLKEKTGNFVGCLLLVGYLIYFALLAGYTAYLFTEVVLKNLLKEESFWLVLVLLLLLVGYGIWEGIEGRARVYEILFWILMIPLFIMLLASLNEVQTEYWTPIFSAEPAGVLGSAYYGFLPFSLVFLLLFLGEYVEKKETLVRAGKRALFFSGSIYGVLYLILLGIFGAGALATMEFPAITLMSTVKMPGGFFKRTDAFMLAVWFFTLYAMLGSAVFYGTTALRAIWGQEAGRSKAEISGRERLAAGILLVVVLVIAGVFYRSEAACHDYALFLWYIGTPFLILVPLCLGIGGAWSRRKKQLCSVAVLLLGTVFLAGCGSPELEERTFPIELAVKDTDSFATEWLNAEQSRNRVMDYNHLKVLILAREFVEKPEEMAEFLDLLEDETDLPRNTYVVVAEKPEEIVTLKGENQESVGEYLEQQFERVSEIKKKMYPTLGMLYQEKENHLETIFLPVVSQEEEKPSVNAYYVWKRGLAGGITDSETTMLSFFTQNALDSYTVTLEAGIVKLSALQNALSFEEKGICVDVKCDAKLLYGSEADKGELKKQLEEYLNKLAAAGLEAGVDVTNSYRKLGGCRRDWYFAYQEGDESYEENLDIVYKTQITWIDL